MLSLGLFVYIQEVCYLDTNRDNLTNILGEDNLIDNLVEDNLINGNVVLEDNTQTIENNLSDQEKNVHYSAYFDEKGVIPYLEIPFPYQKKQNSYPLTFKFSLTLRRKT